MSTPDLAPPPGEDETRAAVLRELSAAAEALWLRWEPVLPGLCIDVLPSVGSTNTVLLDQARAGQDWPALLVAVEQTAGRGRQGRVWHARAGEALTCSLRLPVPAGLEPAALPGLSLATGVALTEALDPPREADPLRLGLKWPNDICLAQPTLGKVGGILIEVAAAPQRCVVIGIGLNLGGSPPAALATAAPAVPGEAPPPLPWSSLAQAGLPMRPGSALQAVAAALIEAWQGYVAGGLSSCQDGFARRDLLAGRPVWMTGTAALAAEATVVGVAGGIDGQGALLVHTAHGLRRLTSGEVSVRPLG